ncbi:Cytochrome P450 734A1-like protein [Drosera capensis]
MSDREKWGWVMNEVLRLYPSSPNVRRQARSDIKVGGIAILNRTNIWIDVVGIHHDLDLWEDDVNEFRPERFSEDMNGGCKHKMGYLPYGFGGRMGIGMEYKIMLACCSENFPIPFHPIIAILQPISSRLDQSLACPLSSNPYSIPLKPVPFFSSCELCIYMNMHV